jgi:hypothetical protein
MVQAFNHTKTTDTMEHKVFIISSWNIQGHLPLSMNPDFIKEIGSTDIVILQET